MPKKKKDILNIHIKSEGINIFSQKFCWTESTIFVVKCQKFTFTCITIIYDIALFQTLKRNYAVNGHEMYCTCVFFYLCVAHILTRTVTELLNSKRFYDKMYWVLHYYFIVQYLMQMTFSYDSTMTTNDLNMP